MMKDICRYRDLNVGLYENAKRLAGKVNQDRLKNNPVELSPDIIM